MKTLTFWLFHSRVGDIVSGFAAGGALILLPSAAGKFTVMVGLLILVLGAVIQDCIEPREES